MIKRVISIILTFCVFTTCGCLVSCGNNSDTGEPISRGQFAKMLVEGIIDDEEIMQMAAATDEEFVKDMTNQDEYYPYAAYLLTIGAENSDNGTFKPNDYMTIGCALTWVSRTLGIKNESVYNFDDNSHVTNIDEISAAIEHGIFDYVADFDSDTILYYNSAVDIVNKSILYYNRFDEVRNAPNTIDYNKDVQMLSSNENNKLVKVEGDTYTFENASDDLKALSEGDKFMIMPCVNIPDGIAIKVGKIDISDNTAVITNDNPTIEDFVENIDIAKKIDLNMDMFDMSYADEGVTLIDMTPEEIQQLSYDGESSPMLLAHSKTDNYDIQQTSKVNVLNNKKFNINRELAKDIEVNGTIALKSADILMDIQYEIGLNPIKRAEIALETESQADINITYGFDHSFERGKMLYSAYGKYFKDCWHEEMLGSDYAEKELSNYKINLGAWHFPIAGTPIIVVFKMIFRVDAKGRILIELEESLTTKNGFIYENSEFDFINKVDPKTHFGLVASGVLQSGIYGEADVTVLNLAGINCNLGFGVGTSCKIEENKNKSKHLCNYCMDGDLYLFGDVYVSASILGKELAPPHKPIKKKFGDYYYSFDTGQGGLGECNNTVDHPQEIIETMPPAETPKPKETPSPTPSITKSPQLPIDDQYLGWNGDTCPVCGESDSFIDPNTGRHICRNCENVELFLEYNPSNEHVDKYNEFVLESRRLEAATVRLGDLTQQQTMNQESANVYKQWDDLLNEVYKYLKIVDSESQYASLQQEEIEWIKKRDSAIESAVAEYEGGSIVPFIRNTTAITYTNARCNQLISRIY